MDAQSPSVDEMILEFARTRDPKLREQIIHRHHGLIRTIAGKFVRPGVCFEDLVQVGWVSLIRALDRYDPSRDTRFSTYAVVCVVGEIKRYFRDKTWGLRVPRQLQEIAANLRRVQDDLCNRLGREPTVPEMARAFRVSEEVLLEAMELQRAYQPASLDSGEPWEAGEDGLSLSDRLGGTDQELTRMVEYAPLIAAIRSLDDRKRLIIQRRFYEGFTQQEVADELGLSQMHISRLERAAIAELKRRLTAEEALAA